MGRLQVEDCRMQSNGKGLAMNSIRSKNRFGIVGIGLFLVLGISTSPALVTKYIGGTGPDSFPDFTSACHWLNQADINDDYLFLAVPGTYVGACTLSANHDPHTVTFRPISGTVTTRTASQYDDYVWYVSGTNNAKIEGLVIVGGYTAAVRIGGVFIGVTGCRFSGDSITGPNRGIYVYRYCTDDSIVNCKITGSMMYPMDIEPQHRDRSPRLSSVHKQFKLGTLHFQEQ